MPQVIKLKRFLLAVIFISLLTVKETAAGEPSLPPEAQTVFDRGLNAVNQQEWGLAIKYFTQAEEAAPHWFSPIFFNLGLAHARAGHELDAIAWLRVYLVADPAAGNVGAVKSEITKLEVAAEAKINKILQATKAATAALEDAATNADVKVSSYLWIAAAQTQVGDLVGARESLAQAKKWLRRYAAYTKQDPDIRLARHYRDVETSHYFAILEAQVKAGDIAGAKVFAAEILDLGTRSKAYAGIAYVQEFAGDFAGAKETAAQFLDEKGKADVYGFIATFEKCAPECLMRVQLYPHGNEGADWKKVAVSLGKDGPHEPSNINQEYLESLKKRDARDAVKHLGQLLHDWNSKFSMLQKREAYWQIGRGDSTLPPQNK